MTPTPTPTPKPSSPPPSRQAASVTPDILANLHELLSRLLAQTPSQSSYPSQEPLEIQHLATEASSVKIKIQKAREKAAALPDVERSVEQQQAEIEELKERIKAQRIVLAGLGVPAKGEDDRMEG